MRSRAFSKESRTVMKKSVYPGLGGLVLFLLMSPVGSGSATQKSMMGPNFKAQIGLQLYSLRDQLGKDVRKGLDQVRDFGITLVETHSTYGLTPQQFRAELDSRGLKAIAGHFPYERCRDDVEGIARDAQILG